MGHNNRAIFTIVVVEDDDDIRTLAVMALELDPSFRVIEARTGAAALQTARTVAGLDLILVDLSLPDMDGFELADALQQIQTDATIPFAFFTASVREAELQRYKAAGARGVIAKPFDPLRLATTVRNLI